MIQALATIAASTVLALSGTNAAVAVPTQEDVTLSATQQREVNETEIAFDHLDRTNNTFDLQGAVDAGASTDTAQRFAYGIVLAGGTITDREDITPPEDLAPLAGQLKACKGKNSVSTQWYGHRVQMNSCVTARVITIIGGSGGIAGGAAYLAAAFPPVAAIAGIVAAAMAIVAGGLAICGSNGHGLVMHQVWTGQPWCTGP